MDTDVRNLIAALHAAPCRFCLVFTGGGTTAAAWLLSVPGGSRTVLEAAVPYDTQALTEYLGLIPDSFCSAETSRLMAQGAFDRVTWLCPGAEVVGIGCTASLRSDRPKRGNHRVHVTVHTSRRTDTRSLTFIKEARDREAEEDVAARVLLNLLAESSGLSDRVPVPLLPGEGFTNEASIPPDCLAQFLAGHLDAVCATVDGRCITDVPRPALLVPGSFNPLHDGHCRLADVAAARIGKSAAFELSVVNADKPPLPDGEVRRRLAQFAWRAPLWLTRAPTFAEKARVFPGAAFVVGADTAARIVQPRFYEDSEERMARALGSFRAHGCRFLVAGRVDEAGRFVGLAELPVPAEFRGLFDGIPEADYRADVSSTQLRTAAT